MNRWGVKRALVKRESIVSTKPIESTNMYCWLVLNILASFSEVLPCAICFSGSIALHKDTKNTRNNENELLQRDIQHIQEV